MTSRNALEFLAMANDFEIEKGEEGVYRVSPKDCNLCAIIAGTLTEYYVTGCYNSGVDCISINIEKLEKLKNFVNCLMGE